MQKEYRMENVFADVRSKNISKDIFLVDFIL